MKTIPVSVGTELVIRVIRWDDGWEFDCPTVVMTPVLRVYEDGRSIDRAIEDFLIDACIDGELKDDAEEGWRWEGAIGGAMAYLRRKRYRKHVQRETVKVRFVLDEDGELSWAEV